MPRDAASHNAVHPEYTTVLTVVCATAQCTYHRTYSTASCPGALCTYSTVSAAVPTTTLYSIRDCTVGPARFEVSTLLQCGIDSATGYGLRAFVNGLCTMVHGPYVTSRAWRSSAECTAARATSSASASVAIPA